MEALADSLVLRLVELDDVVDLELLEVTLTQGPPDRPALAAVAAADGRVVVRITAETSDDADRLESLGWPVDRHDGAAVRRWPADDLLEACWQLVVALFAIGVRWDRPLATTTRLRA